MHDTTRNDFIAVNPDTHIKEERLPRLKLHVASNTEKNDAKNDTTRNVTYSSKSRYARLPRHTTCS